MSLQQPSRTTYEIRTANGISRVITCKPAGTDPTPTAPTGDGSKAGYYNDKQTRELLALEEKDALLVTGTYGNKDLGETPIDIALLQDEFYDRRLLPFMPREFKLFEMRLDLEPAVVHMRSHGSPARGKTCPRYRRGPSRS